MRAGIGRFVVDLAFDASTLEWTSRGTRVEANVSFQVLVVVVCETLVQTKSSRPWRFLQDEARPNHFQHFQQWTAIFESRQLPRRRDAVFR